MPKVGQKVGDVVVIQGDPTQMRKIRCPGCQNLAVVQKDGNGRVICICPACKRRFRSNKM